jgi:hypothetical protein
MTPDLLAKCGTALFGASWQAELSRAIDVSDRTVRRWTSGATPIPHGVRSDIVRLLSARAEAVADLLRELSKIDP